MKLEPKHIASYLPYELRARNTDAGSEKGQEWMGIKKIIGLTEDTVIQSLNNFPYMIKFHISKIIPILIPLSALTELEYENVFDEFSEVEYSDLLDRIDYAKMGLQKSENVCNNLRFEVINALFANHFDVYGLIDAGIAIDKRTLR